MHSHKSSPHWLIVSWFLIGCAVPALGQNPSTFKPLVEEFCTGHLPQGGDGTSSRFGVGELNWTWFLNKTPGARFTRNSTDVNHPCIITAVTGNQAGNEATLRLCTQGKQGNCPGLGANNNSIAGFNSLTFDTYIVFKIADVTDINVQAGFMDESNEDRAELTVEYDSARGDKFLTFVAHNSAGKCRLEVDCKHLASNIAPVADRWIKARIRSITPGTALFSVCMGATPSAGCKLPVSGNKFSISAPFIPSAQMTPSLHLQTRANANKSVTWDYFSFTITGGISR